LLEASDTDLTRILRHFNADPAKVNRELTRSLDRLKTGNARAPMLSEDLTDLMREAWSLTSLEFGESRIRSGHLLAAMLGQHRLAGRVHESAPELNKVNPELLSKNFKTLVSGSAEDQAEPGAVPESAAGPGQPRPDSKTPALDQFTENLTDKARAGKIDPVIGRDFEIRQVIDILTRRRQNNPILAGEAGVGKTAVVEGFAL